MFTVLKVILLGVIEGVTEWLPISSTGHLVIFGDLLNTDFTPEFAEMFNVLIQLGAVAAVIILFFNRLWPFHTRRKADGNRFANPASGGAALKFQKFANNYLYMDRIILWIKIAISCIPALIASIFFEDWLEEHLHRAFPIAIMLILVGVLFILIENFLKGKKPKIRKLSRLGLREALIIGCFQAVALIPGTSRSGIVIIAALILGLSRICAVEYAFFLAIPAMVGGSVSKLIKFGGSFSGQECIYLAVGCIVAFIVSMLVIRALLNFISTHTFKCFGWYRIALGIVVIILSVAGIIGLSETASASDAVTLAAANSAGTAAASGSMFKSGLVTFLVSMVPIVELRGAIPIGAGMGLPVTQALVIAVIGNMVPVPFIYFFARKLLIWGSDKPVIGKFFSFCLEKGEKGGKKLKAKAGQGLFVALLLFVGIPIPGTGAWTGTLAASLLDMGFKQSVIAVVLGVLMAGIIMSAISLGVINAVG